MTGTQTRSRPSRHWRRTASITAATAGAALLLAACSGGGGGAGAGTSAPAGHSAQPAAATAAAATITIKNFAFQPAGLTVKPGTTVTVHNDDPTTHTVTAMNGAFDTGDIKSGATATFTAPSKPGSYSYICQIHQFMHGALTVG